MQTGSMNGILNSTHFFVLKAHIFLLEQVQMTRFKLLKQTGIADVFLREA
jgi:hypothetical protein